MYNVLTGKSCTDVYNDWGKFCHFISFDIIQNKAWALMSGKTVQSIHRENRVYGGNVEVIAIFEIYKVCQYLFCMW
jgi:hypothetical protein